MTAAVTELYTGFFATDWSLFFGRNALTALESNLTIEQHSPVRPQLPVGHASAEADSSFDLFDFEASSQLVIHQLNKSVEAQTTLPENATAMLPISAPAAIQALFERAEKRMQSRTEITAQYAFSLLQRIKSLICEISPAAVHGRMLAVMDEEDGSATVEWIRTRSRIGFVLDQGRESSWFAVLPDGTSKSGYLYGDDGLKSLRGLLEEFLAASE